MRVIVLAPCIAAGSSRHVCALHPLTEYRASFALIAGNKALICWCTDPRYRDTVVKVADVGFLGLLGSLSLAAACIPNTILTAIQPVILQMGFSHLVLEMAFNGIAIPVMCGSVVEERDVMPDSAERPKRQASSRPPPPACLHTAPLVNSA